MNNSYSDTNDSSHSRRVFVASISLLASITQNKQNIKIRFPYFFSTSFAKCHRHRQQQQQQQRKTRHTVKKIRIVTRVDNEAAQLSNEAPTFFNITLI